MRLKIHHKTHYSFDSQVPYGLQQLRVTPLSNTQQNVLSWSVEVSGGKREVSYDDHHRNRVELISFDKDTTDISIVSEGEVDVVETNGIFGAHKGPAPLWLYLNETERTKCGPGCREFVKQAKGETQLEQLHALSAAIRDRVAYVIGASGAHTTAEDAIADGRGVCQDHAHIFAACARQMGMPTRYVSGYLMLDDRIEQDATHAWAETHVDGVGWVGFDVSNGYSPDTRYVRVATGLDYREAAPVSGLRFGTSGEAMSIDIQVQQQ